MLERNAIASDYVGVYSDAADERLEVSSKNGILIGRWKGLGKLQIRGIAVGEDGKTHVTTEGRERHKIVHSYYRIDPKLGNWEKVNHMQQGMLMGSDGDHIVFRNGHELSWIRTKKWGE